MCVAFSVSHAKKILSNGCVPWRYHRSSIAGYQLKLSIDETRCVLQVERSYAAPEIGKRRRVGSSYKTPGKRLSQWTVSTRKLISRASSALTQRERYSLKTYIGIFRLQGIDTLRVKSVARFLRMSQYIFSFVLLFLAAQGESFFFFFFFCFFGFSFVSIFPYLTPEVSRNWLIVLTVQDNVYINLTLNMQAYIVNIFLEKFLFRYF